MKRDLHLTSPHMKGHDVEYAQGLLKNNLFKFTGISIGAEGHYDKKTASSTKRAKYLLGYPQTAVNEVFGDKLELFLRHEDPKKALPWAYKLRRNKRLNAEAAAVPLRVKALAEAEKWIGTKEHPPGSNSCPPFTTWYGLTGPWCAEFVSYILAHVGFKYVSPRSARWAYVPYVVSDARNHRNGLIAISHEDVQPGDLVCYDWDGGEADHIGFFKEWDGNGIFLAVEGNTAVGNDSNGGEVMTRQRSIYQVEQFVRYVG